MLYIALIQIMSIYDFLSESYENHWIAFCCMQNLSNSDFKSPLQFFFP
jgi:hypothetical protein